MHHDPEIVEVSDRSAGLQGWVVIDSTFSGQASGGLRIHPEVSAEELALLARTMTLKYSFLKIPKGGAKAGIRLDPAADRDTTFDLIERFGRKIRPLIQTRRFIPGPDMGTDDALMRHLFHACGDSIRESELWDYSESGRFTATGVVESYNRAARSAGLRPEHATASIEGIGAVGMAVMRMLHARGVRITAIANRYGKIQIPGGIDPEKWHSFSTEEGEKRILEFPGADPLDPDRFLTLPVDSFFPCAAMHTINELSASSIRAKIIVPGANNAITEKAMTMLHEKNVLVLPDFVANCGGVLGGALHHAGIPSEEVVGKVGAVVGEAMSALLREAAIENMPVVTIAKRISLARYRKVRQRVSSRMLVASLAFQRTGLVPRVLSLWLARRYADRLMKNIVPREREGR